MSLGMPVLQQLAHDWAADENAFSNKTLQQALRMHLDQADDLVDDSHNARCPQARMYQSLFCHEQMDSIHPGFTWPVLGGRHLAFRRCIGAAAAAAVGCLMIVGASKQSCATVGASIRARLERVVAQHRSDFPRDVRKRW